MSGDDAVGRARLALNRVTYTRLEKEVTVLIDAVKGMEEAEVEEVVDTLLARAVHGDKGLFGRVAGEVVRGVRDGGVFRKVLHNKCEVNFSRYEEQDETAADGLVRFMAALFLADVMSPKIIHTCLITLLFGSQVDKASVPSPLAIQLSTALLTLTADLLDVTRTHYYLRRLDNLKPHYPPTTTTHHLIDEALTLLNSPVSEVQP
eukprot:TRINITY_DN4178_c0_g1_i1.p1 TRINITY_DN4178_c0_g1~~TRINITY_DN4178_c0_g1_i1.p1  ORF type:complete len:213 (+),score=37.65 TRINITY_DN4178_c0_g1_i1:26-640(+)